MSRPSDPLLRWLRQILKERSLSTPALAQQAGLERGRLRDLLAGQQPMTVDELLQISKVLSLSPADFGLAGEVDDAPDREEAAEASVQLHRLPPPVATAPTADAAMDPLGNHARQLFEVAFALQCDFLFLADTQHLAESGVPAPVLSRYRDRELPIKLDAAYHSYNNPRYDDTGVTLTLSFDALYDCRFPWTAVKQVVYYPAPPPAPPPPAPEKESPPPTKGKPFLRLVE